MALIDYPDPAECDEQTRAILSQFGNEHGEIPAFPRMLANKPAVLHVAVAQFGEVMFGGDLDPTLKQLAFVVVSHHNASAYCAATHGEQLAHGLGLSASQVAEIAAGDDSALTERQRAVAAFARRVASAPRAVGAADVAALRAAGFDDADVVELVAVTAQANFANTVADATGITPGDESPRLWAYAPAAPSPA